jgi:hypothetical protein
MQTPNKQEYRGLDAVVIIVGDAVNTPPPPQHSSRMQQHQSNRNGTEVESGQYWVHLF